MYRGSQAVREDLEAEVRPISEMHAYQRIANKLREQIESGELAPGARLPSLADIAKAEGVSDRTAYEATRVLQSEGLILTRAGTQAIVREDTVVVWLGRPWSPDAPAGSPWRAHMSEEGRVGSWEAHSEKSSAPASIAARLHIPEGAPVMRTDYVFLADRTRIHLSTSYEPLDLTQGTAIMLPEVGPHAGKGVADRMTLIGHAPAHVSHDAVPSTLTRTEAARLGLRAGIPATRVERTYYAPERPLETADIVVPSPHKVRFAIPLGSDHAK